VTYDDIKIIKINNRTLDNYYVVIAKWGNP